MTETGALSQSGFQAWYLSKYDVAEMDRWLAWVENYLEASKDNSQQLHDVQRWRRELGYLKRGDEDA